MRYNMGKFETLEDVLCRVSKDVFVEYYINQNHNQTDTQQYFNISRPNLYKLIDYYDAHKTKQQIAKTGAFTSKRLYGDEHYNNRDAFRDTLTKKYGSLDSAYKNFNELGKQTKLERYGSSNFTNREKAKKTLMERTGYEYGHQSVESIQRASNTYFERTGYTNPSFNPEVKKKISYGNSNLSDEQRNNKLNKIHNYWESLSDADRIELHKRRSESAKKSYAKLSDYQKLLRSEKLQRFQKIHWSSLTDEERKSLTKKRVDTMRRNNTINSSKLEDAVYDYISEKYPDTIRQYRDARYPFCCDFYIPSKDLFIELNAHWTHGGRPYEDNDICNEQLELWKSRAKKSAYYKQAIYVWTDLDVRKRLCYEKNNLNHLIIYTLNELNTEEI